jgi:hypothetical protein
MGVRRERPPIERSNNTVTLRLPDGTVKSMPIDQPRDPVTADRCCFCGHGVQHSDPEWIRLAANWTDEGHEKMQSWGAHHRCLLERMHESVAGTGPFFGD